MFAEFLYQFARNKVAVVSAFAVAGFLLIAIGGPALAPYDPLQQDLINNYGAPSFEHPLGTDHLGRDTLSRLIYGARVSLGISLTSV